MSPDTFDLSSLLNITCHDVQITLSSHSWSQFAFFRVMVQSSNFSFLSSVEMPHDMYELICFLRGRNESQNSAIEKYAFALAVREECNILGLDKGGSIASRVECYLQTASTTFATSVAATEMLELTWGPLHRGVTQVSFCTITKFHLIKQIFLNAVLPFCDPIVDLRNAAVRERIKHSPQSERETKIATLINELRVESPPRFHRLNWMHT